MHLLLVKTCWNDKHKQALNSFPILRIFSHRKAARAHKKRQAGKPRLPFDLGENYLSAVKFMFITFPSVASTDWSMKISPLFRTLTV